MSKAKKKLIKSIHIKTTVILIIYLLLSHFILITSLANKNIFISFLIPLLFGVISSVTFLYLFSHEDFFHFIKNLENKEKENEKKYLKKFMHFGKILTCILISLIGGPIFLALTARFLFPKSHYKYQIVIISNTIATIILIASAKSFLRMIL